VEISEFTKKLTVISEQDCRRLESQSDQMRNSCYCDRNVVVGDVHKLENSQEKLHVG